MNCRFSSERLVAVAAVAAEADAWEVGLAAVELNGACWVTFMFVMLRVNGDELPVYVQRMLVAPHVYISPIGCHTKDGEVLAGAAELLVDAGIATVERASVVMM